VKVPPAANVPLEAYKKDLWQQVARQNLLSSVPLTVPPANVPLEACVFTREKKLKAKKKIVTLLVAMTFTVIVISGLLAFFMPFSILVTGLHSLMGFVFIGLVFLHVKQNFKGMKKSVKSRYAITSFIVIALLTALFTWQPAPIRAILGLSNNLGAALDRFEMKDDGMVYHYSPAENYKLKLEVKAGANYDKKSPPEIAIWLENQSGYHIKSLYASKSKAELPYWAWKVEEYEKAKAESKNQAENDEELDAISGATPNSSFDPKDYILPERNSEAFYLLIEVNQKKDKNKFYPDQPSIIYKVEIDNKFPKAFQVFDVIGYSKFDPNEKTWNAYYPDGTLTTSLKLIDSALLTINRKTDD